MSDHCPNRCQDCSEAWAPVEERHEFHMLGFFNAYCVCGWQASEKKFFDLGVRYREHLG